LVGPHSTNFKRWHGANGNIGLAILGNILYYLTSTVTHQPRHMKLHISDTDGVPIYLQIVNQIKYLVAAGRLCPGDELPPIRTLAETLVVNPNTVAHAYRELETSGVVEKRRTAGTYIKATGSPLAREEQRRILAERIDALLADARQMNFSIEELFEIVRQRDNELPPQSSGKSKDKSR